jgi:hypothetical protein
MTRFAIVVASPVRPGEPEEIRTGRRPRRDYLELDRAIGATLINEDEPRGRTVRIVWRLLGRSAAHAVIAFQRRSQYDVVHTLSEDVGLPLALLFKVFRVRRGHVMVGHRLSPLKKRIFFRLLHVESHIDRVVVYSSPQLRHAVEREAAAREAGAGAPPRRSPVLGTEWERGSRHDLLSRYGAA